MKLELLDHCASDLAVVNSARVSFAAHKEVMDLSDEALLGWLMRNHHGSPFEHGYFRFHVEAPIFVFREWHRHRAGHSYNEMSGRYVEMEEKFYEPDAMRTQQGKPGAYSYVELDPENSAVSDYTKSLMALSFDKSWWAYQELLRLGIAKEQARAVLPLGTYSQMYWSCNPRSLMHFCALRCANDAQKEIRQLAWDALNALKQVMPVTASAFINAGMLAP